MQRVPDSPEQDGYGGLFGLRAILEGDLPIDLDAFRVDNR